MSIRKSSTEKTADKSKKSKVKKGKKDQKRSQDVSEVAFNNPAKAPRVRTKPPKAPKDVYTLVLLISFLFFIVASVLLYLDLSSYK